MSDRGSDQSSETTDDLVERSNARRHRRERHYRSHAAGRGSDEDDDDTPRPGRPQREQSEVATPTRQGRNRHTSVVGRPPAWIRSHDQRQSARSQGLPPAVRAPLPDFRQPIPNTSSTRQVGSGAKVSNNNSQYALFSGVSTSGPQQPPPSNPQEFRSALSALGQGFATIGENDHKTCDKFIKEHPEMLDEVEEEFVREAAAALTAGKDAYARQCIQQSLLLNDCEGLDSQDSSKYFVDLMIREKFGKEFEKNRAEILARLRDQIWTADVFRAQAPDLSGGMSAPTLENRSVHHQDLTQPGCSVTVGRLITPRNSFSSHNRGTLDLGGNRHDGVHRGNFSTSSNAPTQLGPEGNVEILDARYSVKDRSSTFFTVGRVFATMRYSAVGSSGNAPNQSNKSNSWIFHGRFGEKIITHTQRMVVVKEEHGFCWCVPINSYNGKGVAKSGLSKSDVAAHAIIYMDDKGPETSEGEPEMSKLPIAVRKATADQKLDEMSRVNFGKVHTVEHNVKVMNVGSVTEDSMLYFERCWTNQTNYGKR